MVKNIFALIFFCLSCNLGKARATVVPLNPSLLTTILTFFPTLTKQLVLINFFSYDQVFILKMLIIMGLLEETLWNFCLLFCMWIYNFSMFHTHFLVLYNSTSMKDGIGSRYINLADSILYSFNKHGLRRSFINHNIFWLSITTTEILFILDICSNHWNNCKLDCYENLQTYKF